MRFPVKNLLIITTTSLLSGCGRVFEFVYCDYAYNGVENNFYQTGVNLLDKWLVPEHLSEVNIPTDLKKEIAELPSEYAEIKSL